MQQFLLPFLLTLFAGLSTGIGGLIILFNSNRSRRFLSVCMGFSAGVMIYVSMIELFPEAQELLTSVFGEKTGALYTVLSFFSGMLMIAIIDKLIPQENNPHEICDSNFEKIKLDDGEALKRTSMMTAIAIAIHNFPEGIASFVSATHSLEIAIPTVVAIALHNIPEGISVAMPIYCATGDRKKAVRYSFLSGLSEPLGALFAFIFLRNIMDEVTFGIVYAMVAGIMVFISFDELLPGAEEYGEHHLAIYGLVGGMAVMALSLWLFI